MFSENLPPDMFFQKVLLQIPSVNIKQVPEVFILVLRFELLGSINIIPLVIPHVRFDVGILAIEEVIALSNVIFN